jgi:undecaprenyl-diphosphatase
MINQDLFLKINDLAGRNVWMDKLAVFFAVYVGYIIVAYLIYLWFIKPGSRRMISVALIAAVIARFVVTSIIRFLYFHPRPFIVMQVHQLIPESGSSFPSGHAAFFFALSAVTYLSNRKLGWTLFVLSLLMGLARIYAGVHWPLDIVGGIIVGITTGLVVNRLSVWLQRPSAV